MMKVIFVLRRKFYLGKVILYLLNFKNRLNGSGQVTFTFKNSQCTQ